MRIAFYAPFKPLDHPNPSGDLMIGRGIHAFLTQQGHELVTVSRLRSRWIYWKPFALLQARLEQRSIVRQLQTNPADLWLTYHSYYKAPDIIGPRVCSRTDTPYVIIQPSFSTRVSRSWKTYPGFKLNRKALLAADALVTDRSRDYTNLQRLVAPERLHRIKPGLDLPLFSFTQKGRRILRASWQAGKKPVILSAAMFRSDVKTQSLIRLLQSCGRINKAGHDFLLVLIGDGPEKQRLKGMAEELLKDRVLFVGRIAREQMAQYYSAADLFAFPGINESLGMVFLEAQACGLPVVACDNGGISEVVRSKSTGLLTPLDDEPAYDQAILTLLLHPETLKSMGKAAAEYVRTEHDLTANYLQLEHILVHTAAGTQKT